MPLQGGNITDQDIRTGAIRVRHLTTGSVRFDALADFTDLTAWTVTPVNLTVGNGTEDAQYALVGGIYFLFYSLTIGSTTVVGTGPRFPPPTTPAGAIVGYGRAEDTGTVFYPLTIYNASGDVKPGAYTASGSYAQITQLTSTVPFTWTTGDKLVFNAWYPA